MKLENALNRLTKEGYTLTHFEKRGIYHATHENHDTIEVFYTGEKVDNVDCKNLFPSSLKQAIQLSKQ